MKTVFAVLLLFGASSLCASTTPIKLGEETDYVATAVVDIGTVFAPSMTSITGSYDGTKGVRVLYGYFMRKMEPANLPAALSLLQHRLRQALRNDQWTSDLNIEPSSETANPLFFFTSGERGNERLEFYVIIFPNADGTVKIAYEQRRSFTGPIPQLTPLKGS
jgi:hypothetical protein